MSKTSRIYCFIANYERSAEFDPQAVPEWLSLEANWQGYRISTVPWVAEVAKVLDILPLAEDTPEGWIAYLETLGLKEVTPIGCEDFFEARLYC